MSGFQWALVAVSATAAAVAGWIGVHIWRRTGDGELARAMRRFHGQREYAEARFFDIAARSGKPRGLAWVRCDFEDDVAYVRDRKTGQLAALVAVTVGFEAEEGGGMEDVEAVGNLRAATAVFHYAGKQWTTRGRALFNLSPAEAIRYYQESLEIVAEEPAGTT